MLKKILPIILITLLIITMVAATTKFRYSPNVKPHTTYNTLRYGCFYYYGFGSCIVENQYCKGVPVGKNKWIDLGDACDRNDPPRISGLEDITVTETEMIIMAAKCIDEDPVETTYTGWTDKTEILTTYDDAGTYTVTITCTDSFEETIKGTINIIIKDKNRAPLFRAMGFLIE